MELKKKLPIYRDLGVTEVFHRKPTKTLKRANDEAGPYFLVEVQGTLDRYSNDTKFGSDDEIMTIKFRTTKITADKPWCFEVVSISRTTRDEFRRQQEARERMSTK